MRGTFIKNKSNNVSTMSVVFTVFAGRQRYMEVLIPYIQKLVSMKLVSEVHIWDYTRNTDDEKYLKTACATFQLFSVTDKSTYREYYKCYTCEKYPDPQTVIIKCDDDIVFIDTSRFEAFIKARRLAVEPIFMSPSVINNPVCMAIQFQRGLLPGFTRSSVGMTAQTARQIHKYFLKKYKSFLSDSTRIEKRFSEISSTSQWRFNINFVAILGKDLDLLYGDENICIDDENFLGFVAPTLYNRTIMIDLTFVVAHMAYTLQRQDGYDETAHLKEYKTKFLK